MTLKRGWISDLYEKQYKLDTYIKGNQVEEDFNTYDLISAFLVELGEFLNEVRAFKYWSVKEIDKEKAHEEFVDGVHFILSIGNHFWGLEKMGIISSSLEERLEKLETGEKDLYIGKKCDYKNKFVSRSISLFSNSNCLYGTLEEYIDYVVSFMKLGMNVGMGIEDIINEYNKKHEINYLRQVNGY